jgi:hypothetical protein
MTDAPIRAGASPRFPSAPLLPGCAVALLVASASTWARFVAEGSLRLVPNTSVSLLAHAVVGLAVLTSKR